MKDLHNNISTILRRHGVETHQVRFSEFRHWGKIFHWELELTLKESLREEFDNILINEIIKLAEPETYSSDS